MTFLVVVALCLPVSATTILIRKSPTDIFAGADSKMSFAAEPDVQTDKIIEIKPHWYFAAAGHGVIQYGALLNFNVFDSATHCSLVSVPDRVTPTLREFADSCVAQISQDLVTPLQWVARMRPEIYSREFGNRRVLELEFFGEESGSLKSYSRDLFADLLGSGMTSVHKDECEANCSGYGRHGIHELIDAVFNTTNNYWTMPGDVAVCKLIAMEIEGHPNDIGWPIKVLHLTARGGVEWFTHEKNCAQKKSQPVKPTPKRARPTRKRVSREGLAPLCSRCLRQLKVCSNPARRLTV